MTEEVSQRRGRQVKCVVWDLDNTLWEGVLLEGDRLQLRTDVFRCIEELDRRGILNSIASKNDAEAAMKQLDEFGIVDYFLYPQIGWNAKSSSISTIASSLNISTDAIAFVDDQPFERAEVGHALPEVFTVDVEQVASVLERPDFHPAFSTDESSRRRELYQNGIRRDEAERSFTGTSHEFLATLGMRLIVEEAKPENLRRAEELTIRTNQLNSTGVTYSYEDLDRLRTSPDHLVLTASLRDRFGDYGTIGLCLIRKGDPHWHLMLLLTSCRVMSRGVGTVLLNYVMSLAKSAGRRLRADFVDTGRNRMMHIAYVFAGFREVGRQGDRLQFECDLSNVPDLPDYLEMHVPAELETR